MRIARIVLILILTVWALGLVGCLGVQADVGGLVRYRPPGPSQLRQYRERIDSNGHIVREYKDPKPRRR